MISSWVLGEFFNNILKSFRSIIKIKVVIILETFFNQLFNLLLGGCLKRQKKNYENKDESRTENFSIHSAKIFIDKPDQKSTEDSVLFTPVLYFKRLEQASKIFS